MLAIERNRTSESAPFKVLHDFIGIPYERSEGLYLMETELKGSGPRILVDTTPYEEKDEDGKVKKYLGVRQINFNLFPRDSLVHLLPSNTEVMNNPDFIADAVSQFDVYIGTGGQHPEELVTNKEILFDAGEQGGFSRERDVVNALTFQAAKNQGKKIITICRNTQIAALVMGLKLKRSPDIHAKPFSGDNLSTHHSMSVVNEDFLIPALDRMGKINSYHKLSIDGNKIDVERLWYEHRAYVHTLEPTHDIPETLVALDDKDNLQVLAYQWHPERLPGNNGKKAIAFNQEFIAA